MRRLMVLLAGICLMPAAMGCCITTGQCDCVNTCDRCTMYSSAGPAMAGPFSGYVDAGDAMPKVAE